MWLRPLWLICFLLQSTLIGSQADAGSLRMERGIYWDFRSDQIVPGGRSLIDHLAANDITRVHIWLNDNDWDEKRNPDCEKFSYTDSAGTVRWTANKLRELVQQLRERKIKPVFTLSPQEQTKKYIASLSEPDQPLMIARELDVPIELDLEANFSETKDNGRCPATALQPPVAAKQLLEAIRDQRKPLTLIVSTTAWKAGEHQMLLRAADVIAPQLYEKNFAYTRNAIAMELANLWLKFGKPLIPSLSLVCQPDDARAGRCSEKIFKDGLSYVASRAQCGPNRISADGYVLWSASTAVRLSSFGVAHLRNTKGQSIPTDCSG